MDTYYNRMKFYLSKLAHSNFKLFILNVNNINNKTKVKKITKALFKLKNSTLISIAGDQSKRPIIKILSKKIAQKICEMALEKQTFPDL